MSEPGDPSDEEVLRALEQLVASLRASLSEGSGGRQTARLWLRALWGISKTLPFFGGALLERLSDPSHLCEAAGEEDPGAAARRLRNELHLRVDPALAELQEVARRRADRVFAAQAGEYDATLVAQALWSAWEYLQGVEHSLAIPGNLEAIAVGLGMQLRFSPRGEVERPVADDTASALLQVRRQSRCFDSFEDLEAAVRRQASRACAARVREHLADAADLAQVSDEAVAGHVVRWGDAPRYAELRDMLREAGMRDFQDPRPGNDCDDPGAQHLQDADRAREKRRKLAERLRAARRQELERRPETKRLYDPKG